MPVTQLTKHDFKIATNTKDFKRRGATLKLVDAALAEYEAYKGNNPMEQAAYLYMVIKSCDRYAKKLAGVRKSYSGQSSTESAAIQKLREDGVADLRRLAIAKMAAVAPEAGLGLQVFNARKARGVQHATKALHGHYAPERSDYTANKARSDKAWRSNKKVQLGSNAPLAGSLIWGKADHMIEMGTRDVAALKGSELKLATKLRQIGELPDDVAIYHLLGNEVGNWKVNYLNKIQRMKYLIVPNAEGIFMDVQGKLVDPPGGKLMYAMDRFGGLYAGPAVNNDSLHDVFRDTGIKGEYFNHSSFNGGREVICAGILVIRRGELLYIDNNSGHYQPTAANLVECLRSLQADGVRLENVGVSTLESRKGYTAYPEYKALPFMRGQEEPWSPANSLRAWGGGFIKKVPS